MRSTGDNADDAEGLPVSPTLSSGSLFSEEEEEALLVIISNYYY